MGERNVAYRALVGKPEGRGPLERPRRRWEDNIKMDFFNAMNSVHFCLITFTSNQMHCIKAIYCK
jgi:hypothetical protein